MNPLMLQDLKKIEEKLTAFSTQAKKVELASHCNEISLDELCARVRRADPETDDLDVILPYYFELFKKGKPLSFNYTKEAQELSDYCSRAEKILCVMPTTSSKTASNTADTILDATAGEQDELDTEDIDLENLFSATSSAHKLKLNNRLFNSVADSIIIYRAAPSEENKLAFIKAYKAACNAQARNENINFNTIVSDPAILSSRKKACQDFLTDYHLLEARFKIIISSFTLQAQPAAPSQSSTKADLLDSNIGLSYLLSFFEDPEKFNDIFVKEAFINLIKNQKPYDIYAVVVRSLGDMNGPADIEANVISGLKRYERALAILNKMKMERNEKIALEGAILNLKSDLILEHMGILNKMMLIRGKIDPSKVKRIYLLSSIDMVFGFNEFKKIFDNSPQFKNETFLNNINTHSANEIIPDNEDQREVDCLESLWTMQHHTRFHSDETPLYITDENEAKYYIHLCTNAKTVVFLGHGATVETTLGPWGKMKNEKVASKIYEIIESSHGSIKNIVLEVCGGGKLNSSAAQANYLQKTKVNPDIEKNKDRIIIPNVAQKNPFYDPDRNSNTLSRHLWDIIHNSDDMHIGLVSITCSPQLLNPIPAEFGSGNIGTPNKSDEGDKHWPTCYNFVGDDINSVKSITVFICPKKMATQIDAQYQQHSKNPTRKKLQWAPRPSSTGQSKSDEQLHNNNHEQSSPGHTKPTD